MWAKKHRLRLLGFLGLGLSLPGMLSPVHLSLKVISSGQPPLTLQTKHTLNFLSLSSFMYSCDYVPYWILRLQRQCLRFVHSRAAKIYSA